MTEKYQSESVSCLIFLSAIFLPASARPQQPMKRERIASFLGDAVGDLSLWKTTKEAKHTNGGHHPKLEYERILI